MKKLWKKIVQAFAWVGAFTVSALALVGGVLLLRKKGSYKSKKQDLEKSFEAGQKVTAAKQEAESLSYALKVEKAKQETKATASALEHDSHKLADALTRLSDD